MLVIQPKKCISIILHPLVIKAKIIFLICVSDITKPSFPSHITSFLHTEETYSVYKFDFKIMDDECHLTIEKLFSTQNLSLRNKM